MSRTANRRTHTKKRFGEQQRNLPEETERNMNGIGIGLALLGVGIGLGLVGMAAMQGMARQPEAIGKLQVQMLIALAFVELVGLLTIFLLPGFLKGM